MVTENDADNLSFPRNLIRKQQELTMGSESRLCISKDVNYLHKQAIGERNKQLMIEKIA